MSRLREDERNERAIRNLLKLPENRRCINCNSLGPQYVCTSFWTFVCTTCSGIHREFTHRVKSVSMAKFTSQEVIALQGGGNASAKEIYFKEWDSQRQSYPDSSNVERLRDFIKHVYVDKRYTGGRNFDKHPTLKMREAENQGGFRSPPFKPTAGGKSDDGGSKNSYDERLSPGYNQDFGRSPPAEHTDDWRREDRSEVEVQSPDRPRDPEMLSTPKVRPVRNILGDKVSPLRVIEPPKANGFRHMQGTVSSSSLASSNGNPAGKKTESSLIDFDSAPDPPSTTRVPQIQQTASSAPIVAQPTTLNNDWANFDSVQEVKASDTPSNTDFLDVLSELSVLSSSVGISASMSAPAQPGNTLLSSVGATPVSAPISQSTIAYGGAHAATLGTNAFFNTADSGQWQKQAPAQSSNGGSQINQSWNSSLIENTQVLSSSQGAQSHGIDIKQTAKKELPEDLFSSNYASFAAPAPSWLRAPQYSLGFNMQYNVQMPMPPTYMQPSNVLNQFGVNESSPAQAITFPSMAPLQGALPNMVAQQGIQRTGSLGEWMPTQLSHPLPYSSIQHTSSLGTTLSAWTSHPLSLSPQILSYGSAIPSGPYVGQAAPNIQPSRPQAGGFGVDSSSMSFNFNQQQRGSSVSSARGNPFG
uniref:probable ADP-ribosylation factor GTPase-activating protein AGD14 n=1 Tax=Erigeron canadensis TaxID=72917 RepID=UPI001CB95800|nr:probable ADP-ribosylation factor GTPase-activating protein AGD14 [Erigeron canadensis]